jgi:hypothetical protein
MYWYSVMTLIASTKSIVGLIGLPPLLLNYIILTYEIVSYLLQNQLFNLSDIC